MCLKICVAVTRFNIVIQGKYANKINYFYCNIMDPYCIYLYIALYILMLWRTDLLAGIAVSCWSPKTSCHVMAVWGDIWCENLHRGLPYRLFHSLVARPQRQPNAVACENWWKVPLLTWAHNALQVTQNLVQVRNPHPIIGSAIPTRDHISYFNDSL